MTNIKRRLGAAFLLGAFALTGCVSSQAGYGDVRHLVSERTNADVRWRHIDGNASGQQVQKLLGQPLTLASATQIALLNNPDLQAAFEDLGVARADLVSALRLPNPNVELNLGLRRNKDADIEVVATENLATLLFMPLRNGVANAGLDAAKVSVAARALDLAFEVRTTYYRYLAAEQVLELRRSVVLAASASAETARSLHEAGNTTDLDFENEQALYDDARLSLTQAEAELAGTREKLTALLGLWGSGASFRVTGALAEPERELADLNSVEQRALGRSLDLELARHRFEAAGRGANLARAQGLLPRLGAGVHAQKSESWEVGPAFNVEVPLFYQGQGEVARAQAEARRQTELYNGLGVRIRAAARTAAERLSVARERARYYHSVLLPRRERIVNEAQLAYNAMSIGVFQLLQAKRDQIETGRAYVETLRDYWLARAELEQLLAGRLYPSSGASAERGSTLAARVEADGH
jgi:cobalt-zinc-cadmium efflux system outer membrane protein